MEVNVEATGGAESQPPAVTVVQVPAPEATTPEPDLAFRLGQLTEQVAGLVTEVQSIRDQISSAAATAEVALSEATAARSEAEAAEVTAAAVEEVEVPTASSQADGGGDGPPAPRTKGKLATILFG